MNGELSFESFTLSQVAGLLGISRRHAYTMASEGAIPAVKIAGRLRVPRAAWDRWKADQEAAALANVRVAA